MAKVPEKYADKAAKAGESWGQFVVLEPGLYAATLEEVDTTGEGDAGPYWKWVFVYTNQPGKAFLNTSFAERAVGSVGATFRAFDADPREDDTDDLIGEPVILSISKRPVQKGQRKGEIRNNVEAVLPWQDGFTDQVGVGDGSTTNGDAEPAKASGRTRKRAASATSEKEGDWE